MYKDLDFFQPLIGLVDECKCAKHLHSIAAIHSKKLATNGSYLAPPVSLILTENTKVADSPAASVLIVV